MVGAGEPSSAAQPSLPWQIGGRHSAECLIFITCFLRTSVSLRQRHLQEDIAVDQERHSGRLRLLLCFYSGVIATEDRQREGKAYGCVESQSVMCGV